MHGEGRLVVAKHTNRLRRMRAVRFLHKALSQALSNVHVKRLTASKPCSKVIV